MLAVGAARVTAPVGTPVYAVEEYSSRGPAIDGRVKPQIVGVTSEHSSVTGGPFSGTSAAAPHVAGDGRVSSWESVEVETDCDTSVGGCERATRGTNDQPLATMFGDGTWFVGEEIQSGTYSIGSPEDTSLCEWGRIVGQEVVETGGYTLDPITVDSSDDVLFTFGCGTWTLEEQP